ncbi:SDR family NAD(P)-dependent oxidoreductase [Sphingomonas arenae]|uniref:SDR family NAD(P)-dependent oxidoreductase n=1 Tax=Sphingomonas arenae TaxID=2812555 RepID=UPI001967D166|nr:SDR family NAD(P)-dependent oxidoreductase [Sphingomonas arenae]
MTIRFDGRVAIVTGAGAGLGREHALGLAARGAKVVVNDYGPDGRSSAAEETVGFIEAAGGEAIAHGADVADEAHVADMVAKTMERWGRVDILVNNAGILRDKSFAKMILADWEAVMRVHVTGSALCTMAVWPHMREANYGRVVFTSSSSGLYGNFGQSNYGAAKAAMVGMMNVLHLEGAKSNIRVNTLAPGAATQMTRDLLPPQVVGLMEAKAVTPGLLYLVSEDAPSRAILCATAGGYARTLIIETEGIFLEEGSNTPEAVAEQWAAISDPTGASIYEDGAGQVMKFVGKAAKAAGLAT